jgi:hypothetical protein
MSDPEKAVKITGAGVTLMGDLVLHRDPKGLVIFAHGSGSSRHSVRNNIPGATHLFEEAGTLEQVAELAAQWFVKQFPGK